MEKGKTSRNKSKWFILVAIIILSLGFVYLNSERLAGSPRDNSVDMDEATCIAANDAGYVSLADSFGMRVLILSPERELTGNIKYSKLSAVTPNSVRGLAMSDECVYILDHYIEDGTKADRILVYDFRGGYLSTLVSTINAKADYEISSVSCDGDKIYAVCHIALEDGGYQIALADISDGKFKKLREFSIDGDPYTSVYQADLELVNVITNDGRVFISEGDELVQSELEFGERQLDQLVFLEKGDAIGLDVNANQIIRFYENGMSWVITDTGAEAFCINEENLIYGDYSDDCIRWYNLITKRRHAMKYVTYSNYVRTMQLLTWSMLAIGCLGVLIVLIMLVRVAIFKAKNRNNSDEKDENILTTGKLYGKVFVFSMIAFIVCSVMLGTMMFNQTMNKHRSDVLETTYTLSKNSRVGFGDALEAIQDQTDYASPEYERLMSFMNYSIIKDAPLQYKTEMSCIVFRANDDGSMTYINDSIDNNRIGTKLNEAEQETKLLKVGLDYTKEGRFNESVVSYNGGNTLYQIYAPVYNSDGEYVGAIITNMDESKKKSDVLMDLVLKLMEVFTLLAGISMLIAETQYALKVGKIQRERRKAGVYNTTVVEADRTINIILKMPDAIIIVFITLIAMTVLEETGKAQNAFLIALPVTLCSIVYIIGRIIVGTLVKFNPKRWMYLSKIFEATGGGVCILSVIMSSYPLLLAGTIIAAFGIPISYATGSLIRMSGKLPAEEYKLMVFGEVECAIDSAIATTIGAVIRVAFGDIGVMIFLIAIAIVAMPIIKFFVGDDLKVEKSDIDDAEEKVQNESKLKTVLASFRMVWSKELVMAMIFVTLPVGFLGIFGSYLLPLVNASLGLSDVFIGTITFVIQLIVIFVIPLIINELMKFGETNPYVMAATMAFAGVLLLVFGIDGSMKSFIAALLALAIVKVLSMRIADAICLMKAEETGVNANDILVIQSVMSEVGGTAGPTVLGVMLLSGISSIGYIWAIICGVCALLIVLLGNGMNKHNTIKKA